MCYFYFIYFPILKIPNYKIKCNIGNLINYLKLLAFPTKIIAFM